MLKIFPFHHFSLQGFRKTMINNISKRQPFSLVMPVTYRIFILFFLIFPLDIAAKPGVPDKKFNNSIAETSWASSILKYGQKGISIDQSRWLPKTNVDSAKYWSTQNWAKIVITTGRPIPYLYGPLPPNIEENNGYLFYVDLIDTQPSTTPEPLLQEENGLLRHIEFFRLNNRITRFRFELNAFARIKSISYEAASQNIITLEFRRSDTNIASTLERQNGQNGQHKFSHEIQRIILDPGHGGHDPGAVWKGMEEKNIVLSISRKVQQIFQERTLYQVRLTRDSDYFVSTEERAFIAKKFKGDLFVSLHLNANKDTRVHGIESYYLDLTTNQQSLRVAARENAMDFKGVQNFSAILKDLKGSITSSGSNRLAQSIHTRLIQNISSQYRLIPRDLGVKEAPFVVLLRAEMPATLIELAFITHLKENKRLRDIRYQAAVAEGIFNGIQHYILEQRRL